MVHRHFWQGVANRQSPKVEEVTDRLRCLYARVCNILWIRVLAMLDFTNSNGLTVECFIIRTSLFYSGYLLLNTLLYIVEKQEERGSSQVSVQR